MYFSQIISTCGVLEITMEAVLIKGISEFMSCIVYYSKISPFPGFTFSERRNIVFSSIVSEIKA